MLPGRVSTPVVTGDKEQVAESLQTAVASVCNDTHHCPGMLFAKAGLKSTVTLKGRGKAGCSHAQQQSWGV